MRLYTLRTNALIKRLQLERVVEMYPQKDFSVETHGMAECLLAIGDAMWHAESVPGAGSFDIPRLVELLQRGGALLIWKRVHGVKLDSDSEIRALAECIVSHPQTRWRKRISESFTAENIAEALRTALLPGVRSAATPSSGSGRPTPGDMARRLAR